MLKPMKIAALALCLSLLSSTSFAQIRKYSNEFLNIGVGARALGMSNAQIVSVDDVTSGYWNPAGLASIENNMQLAGMHSAYFGGLTNYDYGALARKIDTIGGLSIGLVRFGVDDIPNTSQLIDAQGNIDYDRITSFSAVDNAVLVGYARKTKVEGLRWGTTAKIIRRKVGDMAGSWGFGIDLGAQYDWKKWHFAAVGRDITTTFNSWTYNLSDDFKQVLTQTGNDIPVSSVEITAPHLILGGARGFDFNEKNSLWTELNADITFDGMRNVLIDDQFFSIAPNFGVEYSFKKAVFLRGGIGNFQRITNELGNRRVMTFQPNLGIGLKIKNLSIDYALTDVGDQSVALLSNVFSLKLGIDKK